MKILTPTFFVAVAASLTPAVFMSQESSKPKAIQMSRENPFVGLGDLKISGKFEVEGTSAKEAPTEKQLAASVAETLVDGGLNGTLPGRVEIRMNAFRSKSGDVVYNLQLELIRPSVILGSTQVVDVPVWHVSSVGKCDSSGAKEFILDTAKELVGKLNAAIKESDRER